MILDRDARIVENGRYLDEDSSNERPVVAHQTFRSREQLACSFSRLYEEQEKINSQRVVLLRPLQCESKVFNHEEPRGKFVHNVRVARNFRSVNNESL